MSLPRFELKAAGLSFKRQMGIPLYYKGFCSRNTGRTLWWRIPSLSGEGGRAFRSNSHSPDADVFARDGSPRRARAELQQCPAERRHPQNRPVAGREPQSARLPATECTRQTSIRWPARGLTLEHEGENRTSASLGVMTFRASVAREDYD